VKFVVVRDDVTRRPCRTAVGRTIGGSRRRLQSTRQRASRRRIEATPEGAHYVVSPVADLLPLTSVHTRMSGSVRPVVIARRSRRLVEYGRAVESLVAGEQSQHATRPVVTWNGYIHE